MSDGKLTLQQKRIIIKTLHWESEYNHRVQDDAYGDTAAWNILERWLSEILGVDFRKDIYNNEHIAHFNKQNRVIEMLKESGNNAWFLGDNLKDQLCHICWEDKSSDEEIIAAERNTKETWKKFLDLYKPSFDLKYKPEQNSEYPVEILYHMETGEIYLLDMGKTETDLLKVEMTITLETGSKSLIEVASINIQEFEHIGWL